jgi:hypothetical protein
MYAALKLFRSLILVATLTGVLLLGVAGAALAAQPGAECGDDGAELMPPGFTTGGFDTAEHNYAGSLGTHSLVSDNEHAVSQYDIACVHFTASH